MSSEAPLFFLGQKFAPLSVKKQQKNPWVVFILPYRQQRETAQGKYFHS